MTLGIVTGFSLKNAAGLEQALIELLVALEKAKSSDLNYRIYTSAVSDIEQVLQEKHLTSFEVVRVGFGRFWKYAGLYFAPRADVYLYNGPLIPPFFAPGPSVVLTYDFAYRHNAEDSFKMRLRNRIMDTLTRRAFKQASKVVSISEATKKDIQHFFSERAAEKTIVIPLGFKDLTETAEKNVMTPTEGYFLFVGTVKERKNVLNLVCGYIRAVEQSDVTQHLLIAGRFDSESLYGKRIRELVDGANVRGRIHFLGPVTDGELQFLYKHATAFLFPSRLEGFGMPVLEAMCLGVPVMTSSTSSLPEVAGDAALLVDPESPEEIAHGIVHLAEERNLRNSLKEKGVGQAKLFSWDRCVRSLLHELKQVGEKKNSRPARY
jgi:glycosyltransferase involved in cell wall biosynthesis